MSHSHEHIKITDNTLLGQKHARVLKAVLAINAFMAVIEGAAGYIAHSTSMIADTLDMLGDSLDAGVGLFVNKRSERWQAGAAIAKAGFMAILGVGVLAAAAFAFFNPVLPLVATMGVVGAMALAANTTCALLLYRYRNDNINIKSTLICTRNDMISNMGVLAAAAVTHFIVSPLPDIIVGVAVAGLFIRSAVNIARESISILRSPEGARAENSAAAAPRQPAPKIAPGFKNVLRAIFNRKAAEKPLVAPAKKPVIDGHAHNGPDNN